MSLFKIDSANIVIDASWLQPLSNPPNGKPVCREADLKHMANHLTDMFRTGQARNLFIYGKPGTGKTALVKYVLGEAAKHAHETNMPILTRALYVCHRIRKRQEDKNSILYTGGDREATRHSRAKRRLADVPLEARL